LLDEVSTKQGRLIRGYTNGHPSAFMLDTLQSEVVKQGRPSLVESFQGVEAGLRAVDGLSRPAASYALDDFRNLVLDACLLNEVACDDDVCARRRRG
jgi:hypothetical protein